MADPDLPTIPTDANVIELSERSAPRTCPCDSSADFYVFVTDEDVAETGGDVAADEWPVNVFLCREHFKTAERVSTVADHPEVETDP